MPKSKLQKMSEESAVSVPEPVKLVHHDLLDAIAKNDITKLETILKSYSDKIFYPSLKTVEVQSFEAVKMLKQYYGPLFDVNLYKHICRIPEKITDPKQMKECANFYLDNSVNFMEETGYGQDSISHFHSMLYWTYSSKYSTKEEVTDAHKNSIILVFLQEVVKRDKLLRANINFNRSEYYSYQTIMKSWNPKPENMDYYLGFVEECMKAGMLFDCITDMHSEIQKVIKKYSKSYTVVKRYNC